MALRLDQFSKLPLSEANRLMDEAIAKAMAEDIAELRRPVRFTEENTSPGDKIALMCVQYGEGANYVSISWDGAPENIRRAPLMSKLSRPITARLHSQVAWEPGRLGFQIYVIPGWLAIQDQFAQARSPQLTDSVEWTDEQREAWKAMRRTWEHVRITKLRRAPKTAASLTRNDVA